MACSEAAIVGGASILSPLPDWPSPRARLFLYFVSARAHSALALAHKRYFFLCHVHCKEDLASNPDWFQIFEPNSTAQDYPPDILRLKRKIFPFEATQSPSPVAWNSPVQPRELRLTEEDTSVCMCGALALYPAYFVWTDLRNNPWVLLAEVSTTTLVLYQSI